SVARGAGRTMWGHYNSMAGTLVVAFIAGAIPLLAGTTGSWVAAFFAILWVGSPAFAWAVSRSAETEARLQVTPEDRAELRDIARRTWLYFETFVTAEHNMLPPDNFQETPQPVVAGRTSPTNIGMYLLSVTAA